MSEQNKPKQEFWTDERAEQNPIQAKLRRNMLTRMFANDDRREELYAVLEPQEDQLLSLQQARDDAWREWKTLYDDIQTQGTKSGDNIMLLEAKIRYHMAVNAFRRAHNHWEQNSIRQEIMELDERYNAMREMYVAKGFEKAKASPEK